MLIYNKFPEATGFNHNRDLVQSLFDIPVINEAFESERARSDFDIDLLKRFVFVCRRLSNFTFFFHDGKVMISFTDEGEKISEDFPSDEATIAATTVFRQLYGTDVGSFNRTMKNFHLYLNSNPSSKDEAIRSVIEKLSSAEKLLRKFDVATLADKALRARMDFQQAPLLNGHNIPEEIMKIYFYGDYIHWVTRSKDLENIKSDNFSRAMTWFSFARSLTVISHIYFHFADLLVVTVPELDDY